MKVCLKLLIFLISLNFTYSQGESEIKDLKNTYCKDARTCIFEIKLDSANKVITGKTSNLALFEALTGNDNFFGWTNEFVLLPASNAVFSKWAIINVSVANLRTDPKESAELASQALLGMPVKVYEKQRGWYRIQTPDDYIGWIDGLSIAFKTEEEIKSYKNQPKLIITVPYSAALNAPNKKSEPLSDLSFGNVLVIEQKYRKYSLALFPDGRKAYINNKHAINLADWQKKAHFEPNVIADYSKKLMGVPYLWGGTSFKGVDCSGFTRTSFFSAGVLLPRDASQQQVLGENIEFDNSFEKLEKGDLIFFGKKENQRATHVAIYLGNKKFIHSSGMVRINSFDQTDPNFDEYNLNRILFVKRLHQEDIRPISKIYFNY